MRDREAAKWDALGGHYAFWRTAEYDPAHYRDMLDRVPRPCATAVDVGCGAGLLAAVLAAGCRRVVGIDISWRMLLLARRHLHAHRVGNVHLVLADAERPPLREGTVDFVFSVNTLHHTDLDASLPVLRRLLARGGRMAVRLVTVRRRRASQWLPIRLAYSLRALPGTLRRHGLVTGAKIATLFFHPLWFRPSSQPKLTREDVVAIATRRLPSSRVTGTTHESCTVFWEASGAGEPGSQLARP